MINSVFNIRGYSSGEGKIEIPTELESLVQNDFDIDEFKNSLHEHKKQNSLLHREMLAYSSNVDQFNSIINRISTRDENLKPFNKGLVRTLKYGESSFLSFKPLRKFIVGGVEGYNTEELVGKYCEFFEEQASDFGELFYHIVERENKLTNYSNALIKKNQFYETKKEDVHGLLEIGFGDKEELVEKIKTSEGISERAKSSLISRTQMKYDEIKDSKEILEKLVGENGNAMCEVDGLMKWCSGMKNVLAFGKERMDNYAIHLNETLTTYLQATSINRSFRDTNSSISGLVDVMCAAQNAADDGITNVVDFIKKNGVYLKPKSYGSLF